MYEEKLLMTPGPTMLPPAVREAMGRQIIHHRTKEFESVFENLKEGLKFVFQTKNHVITMVSSGTGAMEAAIANFFSPGDKVLAVSVGNFGERFAEIANAFGLNTEKMAFEWGHAADPQKIKEVLDSDKDREIKAVIMTHNETSTGVTNDIETVGRMLKNGDRLFIIDAISSAGALDIKTDEWGIDVVVAGSQKGLMTPPGLSFISVSDRAWAAAEKARLPKFYWDLNKYKKGLLKEVSENPPYTPAVSLVMGQAEAINIIREEGLDNVFRRHKSFALAVQEGARALGLELLPEQKVSSYVITAIKAPEGVDIDQVRKIMNEKYNIMVTGGQKHLKGKIIRIGHCGYVSKFDIIKTFAAFEYALNEAGYSTEIGKSVSAVQRAFGEG